jgi:hypothetical protein
MRKFRFTLQGLEPLLVHNSRLSNPLDPTARALKAVTGKRQKTDDDYLRMANLEFLGSLYIDQDAGPYLPGDNIWRCLYDGARKHKLGPKVKESVVITSNVNPLSYRGPRDADTLWKDESFRHQASAKVGMQRVTRTRPVFRQWSADAEGVFDETEINLDSLRMIAETSGSLIGIGDWRPRFGRFVGEITEL